ncbi:MAG TPA: serine hydrolase domain-containing protein [Acidimicrobiales bacterium]|nr:serine hydrolase domain-containing protein [Acidimicrobiales bacterium]
MKVDAAAAGMDEGRLARIDEHLRRNYLEQGKLAGCSVAVVRHGEVAHASYLGLADRERDVAVDEGTIWRIYSMTKPITGVALMTLYEQGYFQLSDPVSRFIPSWKRQKVAVRGSDGTVELVEPDRPVSVRDVMMHMSGIGYGTANADLDLGNPADRGSAPVIRHDASLEAMAERLADEPLRFQPGTHWLYSLGTDVCSRLVEVISGQPFDEYLRRVVFEPLGMVDTGFSVDDDRVGRLAANYGRNSRRELVCIDDPQTSSYRRPPSFLSGGGGLVSTLPDYVRFASMLANGGELDGRRVLGRKTVELMTLNHIPGGRGMADVALPGSYGEVGFDGMGFGLTMAVSLGQAQAQVIGSPGEFMWGGAASTTFWVDPAEDLAVVFMVQFMPSGTFNFRGQLKTLVYPAIVD